MNPVRFAFRCLALFVALCAVGAGMAETGRSSRVVVITPERAGEPAPDFLSPLLLQGSRVERNGPLEPSANVRSGWGSSALWGRVRVPLVGVTLLHDGDTDGYFRVFDLRLDIDTDGVVDRVYLKLYASYEGGPWNLLHRSGDFALSWRLSSNEVELTIFLDSGYPSGIYDLRVELFDADTGRWLVSLGPYERAPLAALPLEDARRDGGDRYDNAFVRYDVVAYGGGSFGSGWLMLLWRGRRFSVRDTRACPACRSTRRRRAADPSSR